MLRFSYFFKKANQHQTENNKNEPLSRKTKHRVSTNELSLYPQQASEMNDTPKRVAYQLQRIKAPS